MANLRHNGIALVVAGRLEHPQLGGRPPGYSFPKLHGFMEKAHEVEIRAHPSTRTLNAQMRAMRKHHCPYLYVYIYIYTILYCIYCILNIYNPMINWLIAVFNGISVGLFTISKKDGQMVKSPKIHRQWGSFPNPTNVGIAITNHPIFDGLYHPLMVMNGGWFMMVYY